jgi:cysteine-rich repeat protein
MTPGWALHDFFLHLKQHIHLRNLLKLKAGVLGLAGLKIALTHGAFAQLLLGKLLLAKALLAHVLWVTSLMIKVVAIGLVAGLTWLGVDKQNTEALVGRTLFFTQSVEQSVGTTDETTPTAEQASEKNEENTPETCIIGLPYQHDNRFVLIWMTVQGEGVVLPAWIVGEEAIRNFIQTTLQEKLPTHTLVTEWLTIGFVQQSDADALPTALFLDERSGEQKEIVFVRTCKKSDEATAETDTQEEIEPTQETADPVAWNDQQPTPDLPQDTPTTQEPIDATEAEELTDEKDGDANKKEAVCITALTIPHWSQAGYRIQWFRIADELYELYAPTDAVDELQLALDDLMQARASDVQATVSLEEDILRITLDTYDPNWNMAIGSDQNDTPKEFSFVSDCGTQEEQQSPKIDVTTETPIVINAPIIQAEVCDLVVDEACMALCVGAEETCISQCTTCPREGYVIKDSLDSEDLAILDETIIPVVSKQGEEVGMQVLEEVVFVDGDTMQAEVVIPADTTIQTEDGETFLPTDMVVATSSETELEVGGIIHSVIGSIEYGIPGQGIIFDQPVEVTFPVAGVNEGDTIDLVIDHEWVPTWTLGLTMDPTSTCSDGIASNPGSRAVVFDNNGVLSVKIWTCRGSIISGLWFDRVFCIQEDLQVWSCVSWSILEYGTWMTLCTHPSGDPGSYLQGRCLDPLFALWGAWPGSQQRCEFVACPWGESCYAMKECTWGNACTYDSDCGPGSCDGGVCVCPDDCPNNPCGDGTVDPWEECDDNNPTSGDWCDSYCNFETPRCDLQWLSGTIYSGTTERFSIILTWSNTGRVRYTSLVYGDGDTEGGLTTWTHTYPHIYESGGSYTAILTVSNVSSWAFSDTCSENVQVQRCGDGTKNGPESCDGTGQAQCATGYICSDCDCLEVITWSCGTVSGTTIYDANNNGDSLTGGSPNLCASGTVASFTYDTTGHTWSWNCNGANGGGNASCSADEERCGDGITNNGEECDDSNALTWDGCSNLCTLEFPTCTLTVTTGTIYSGDNGEYTILIPGANTGRVDYDSLLYGDGDSEGGLNTGQSVYTHIYDSGGVFTATLTVSNVYSWIFTAQCTANITVQRCGDSVLQTGAGESCDDGADGDPTDGCNDLCQITTNGLCGVLDGTGVYDADNSGDALTGWTVGLCASGSVSAFTYDSTGHTRSRSCTGTNGGADDTCGAWEEWCGDALTGSAPIEFCDWGTGNWVACTPPYGTWCSYCTTSCNRQNLQGGECWDWTVDTPDEQCDFWDTDNWDGCDSTCQREVPECTLSVASGTIYSGQLESFTIGLSGSNTWWIWYDSLLYGDGDSEWGLNTGQAIYTHIYASGGGYTATLTVSNALSGASGITNTCDAMLDVERCGDATVNGGEACDDGANGDPDDGCNDLCQITDTGVCGATNSAIIYDFNNSGDSLTWGAPGLCSWGTLSGFTYDGGTHSWTWSCLGTNGGSDDYCGATEEYCGDALAQTGEGEQCDDGANGDDNDWCNDLCETTEMWLCGVVSGTVIYDFNNSWDSLESGDAGLCASGTVINFTYDTGAHNRSWTCSWFNGADDGLCSADEERCGDSITNGGEFCDDGANGDPNDGCNDSCEFSEMGLCGVVSGTTIYDFNNSGDSLESGDAGLCVSGAVANFFYDTTGHSWSWACTWVGGADDALCSADEERCGDAVSNGSEACDDGANGDPDDGCNDSCELTDTGICWSVDGDSIYDFNNSGDSLTWGSTGLCTAGILSWFVYDTGTHTWSWECAGMSGGSSDTCWALEERCGDTFAQTGNGEQCDDWINGDDNDWCNDLCQTTQIGVCGSVSGTTVYDFNNSGDLLTGWSPDLCASGTVANFTYDETGHSWSWECTGFNGADDVLCSADEERCGDVVTNGGEACDDGANGDPDDGCNDSCQITETWVCGSQDGQIIYDFNNSWDSLYGTSATLCSGGMVTSFEYNTGTHTWSWICDGTNGASDDSCSADEERCGDSISNGGEACDDGANGDPNDGCNDTCALTEGGTCGSVSGSIIYDFDNNGDLLTGGSPDLCLSGSVDAFFYDTTGHSWSWTCTWVGGADDAFCGAFEERCGDNSANGGEFCDDGANGDPNDGCNDACEITEMGVCGSVSGTTIYDFDNNGDSLTGGATGLCDAGTITWFTYNTWTHTWSWSCAGVNGADDAICWADEDRCGDFAVTWAEACDGTGQAQCGVGESCFACACTTDPIDGICGSQSGQVVYDANNSGDALTQTSANLCSFGVVINFVYDTTGHNRSWECTGANGGTDVSCGTDEERCGDSVTNGGEACDDGADGDPDDGCNDSCQITETWVCGSQDGQTIYDFNNSWDSLYGTSANLCSGGIVTSFTYNSGTHTWSWICDGTNGASDDSCSADEERCGDSISNGGEACDDGANGDDNDWCNDLCEVTQIGVCGSISGTTIYDFNNSGDSLYGTSANLCASGTVTNFSYDVTGHSWSWNCSWFNGADDAFCSADEERCGDSIINGGEACDDGANGDDNDWCNDLCEVTQIGVCGSVSGTTIYDFNNSWDSLYGTSANLCTSGTVTNFSYDVTGHSWSWACTWVGGADDAICSADEERCGDAVTNGGEACDDGADGDPDDGCNDSCQITETWVCGTQDGQIIYDFNNSGDSLSGGSAGLCSGGLVIGFAYDTWTHAWTWICDGTNGASDDSCGATEERCGDTIANGGEACDDGMNGDPNDWCNDLCQITETWVCGASDGIVIYDANNNGDSLSGGSAGLCSGGTLSGFVYNTGAHTWSWTCAWSGGADDATCWADEDRCGDFVVTGAEACDGTGQAQCGVWESCFFCACTSDPVDGVCGAVSGTTIYDANNSGDSLSWGSAGLCGFGDVSNFVYDETGHSWSWECTGANGGNDVSCAADETRCGDSVTNGGEACDDGANGDPDDGCNDSCQITEIWVCGAQDGQIIYDFSNSGDSLTWGSPGLCSGGIAIGFAYDTGTHAWTWICDGTNGASDDSCSATEERCGDTVVNGSEACDGTGQAQCNVWESCATCVCYGDPVNGVCGSVSGTTLYDFNNSWDSLSGGTTGLCSLGTVTNFSYDVTWHTWSWTCTGAFGGNDVSCGADESWCGDGSATDGEVCDDWANGDPDDGCNDLCQTTLSGACGAQDGQIIYDFNNSGDLLSGWSTGLCDIGVATWFTYNTGTHIRSWICEGINGASDDACNAGELRCGDGSLTNGEYCDDNEPQWSGGQIRNGQQCLTCMIDNPIEACVCNIYSWANETWADLLSGDLWLLSGCARAYDAYLASGTLPDIDAPGIQIMITWFDGNQYACDFFLLECNPDGLGTGFSTGDIPVLTGFMSGTLLIDDYTGSTVHTGTDAPCNPGEDCAWSTGGGVDYCGDGDNDCDGSIDNDCIDGVCGPYDSSTIYDFNNSGDLLSGWSTGLCDGGILTWFMYDTGTHTWSWNCIWVHSWADVLCSADEERCGDAITNWGEACDDGNGDPTDGCNTLCQITTNGVCGPWDGGNIYDADNLGDMLSGASTGLCDTGIVANFIFNTGTHTWSWDCVGSWGSTASCGADEDFCGDFVMTGAEACDGTGQAQCAGGELCVACTCISGPVDGICGGLDGTAVYDANNSGDALHTGSFGLCGFGDVINFVYDITGHFWSWDCTWANGGNDTSCNANEERCGDTVVDNGNGESCDDWANGDPDDGCNDLCQTTLSGACGAQDGQIIYDFNNSGDLLSGWSTGLCDIGVATWFTYNTGTHIRSWICEGINGASDDACNAGELRCGDGSLTNGEYCDDNEPQWSGGQIRNGQQCLTCMIDNPIEACVCNIYSWANETWADLLSGDLWLLSGCARAYDAYLASGTLPDIDAPGIQIMITWFDGNQYACDFFLLECNPDGLGTGFSTGDIPVLTGFMSGTLLIDDYTGSTVHTGTDAPCNPGEDCAWSTGGGVDYCGDGDNDCDGSVDDDCVDGVCDAGINGNTYTSGSLPATWSLCSDWTLTWLVQTSTGWTWSCEWANSGANQTWCELFITDCTISNGTCELSCAIGTDPDCEYDCNIGSGCVAVETGAYNDLNSCDIDCDCTISNGTCELGCAIGTDPDCEYNCNIGSGCVAVETGAYNDLNSCDIDCDCTISNGTCELGCLIGTDPDCEYDCNIGSGCVAVETGAYSDLNSCDIDCDCTISNGTCELSCAVGTDPDCEYDCTVGSGCISVETGSYNTLNACTAVCGGCGDGFLTGGEACDDGANGNPDDGCNDLCQITATGICGSQDGQTIYDFNNSGNSLTWWSAGICSGGTLSGFLYDTGTHTWSWFCLGTNGASDIFCNANETRCGDAITNGGEQCDDGTNGIPNDGCSDLCQNSGTWGGGSGSCVTNSDCNDGLYCNGTEICTLGSCEAWAPVVCNDGMVCSTDSCDEINDQCVFDTLGCACLTNADCDDNLYCNGIEQCSANVCVGGAPVVCNDGLVCSTDSCDELNNTCDRDISSCPDACTALTTSSPLTYNAWQATVNFVCEAGAAYAGELVTISCNDIANTVIQGPAAPLWGGGIWLAWSCPYQGYGQYQPTCDVGGATQSTCEKKVTLTTLDWWPQLARYCAIITFPFNAQVGESVFFTVIGNFDNDNADITYELTMDGTTLEADTQAMDWPLSFHTAFGSAGQYKLRARIEDHTNHKELRCIGEVQVAWDHGSATAGTATAWATAGTATAWATAGTATAWATAGTATAWATAGTATAWATAGTATAWATAGTATAWATAGTATAWATAGTATAWASAGTATAWASAGTATAWASAGSAGSGNPKGDLDIQWDGDPLDRPPGLTLPDILPRTGVMWCPWHNGELLGN